MSLGNMEQRTEGMKRQAQELIEEAYNRGYNAGQENALAVDSNKYREQGRNEAWEAAGKLVSMGHKECNEVLGDHILRIDTVNEIFTRCTASEAIEKIRAYEAQKQEEEDEIRVGDEVYLNDGKYQVVVTGIYDLDEKQAVYMYDDGRWGADKVELLKKTGRAFPQISEVLKMLQEGE